MNNAVRYMQLTALIQKLRPQVVLEVGTWRGDRAVQMVRASGNVARYVGFDLFEDATEDTDKEENNVKKHFTEQQVESRLREAGLEYELVKGNTRTTLPAYVKAHPEPFVDFALIDGGHSITTIRSDWAHVKKLLKPAATVVFDDWYEQVPADSSFAGCNPVIEKLSPMLLPLMDVQKNGTTIQMAVVRL